MHDLATLFMGTVKEEDILFTGGSGTLGAELKKLFTHSMFPPHEEFDVILFDQCSDYIIKTKPKIIVHCAAIKTPPKIDKNPIIALKTNIIGTSNLVEISSKYGIRLIYISSDYVFSGKRGLYKEDDEDVYPISKYGWSKLGGECAIRMYDNSLIVRISFFPDVFPYEKAFIDQYVSRIPVSMAAEILKKIIYSDLVGIINVGGKAKSTYEFALSTSEGKEIKEMSIKDINPIPPANTTMDISKLEKFLGRAINI